MPLYLDIDRGETRATTHRLMAAIERFVDFMFFGPRLHDADLRWSLGPVPRLVRGETLREGVQK